MSDVHSQSSSSSNPTDSRLDDAQRTRRQFVREVGTALFAVTIVDIADMTALAQSTGCGSTVPDTSCSQTNGPDGNCGYKTGGGASDPYDPDEHCSASDNDQNCGKTEKDVDESCATSPANKDENCNEPTKTPGVDDVDNSCMSGSTDESCGNENTSNAVDQSCAQLSKDENCHGSQLPNPSQDEDQSCTPTAAEADQSWGDCDDNHDTDEHCGQNLDEGKDSDDLCGHQHLENPVTGGTSGKEDQACGASSPDAGCGIHETSYGGKWTDTDEYCEATGSGDMNCASAATDDTCGDPANPSTTSPDEKCSPTESDEACGHYDEDQNCGAATATNKADEACGVLTVIDPIIGAAHNYTDTDDYCVMADPDSSCINRVNGNDHDQS